MPVVLSVISESNTQADGRVRVIEEHTDQYGVVYPITYLAAVADNISATMTARAPVIYAGLVAAEIEENISAMASRGSLADPALRYSTLAENGAEVRKFYRTATQRQAIMVADYLATLTDAQLRTAFSMTAGQVTTLRTNKLTPAVSLATSIRAATGA